MRDGIVHALKDAARDTPPRIAAARIAHPPHERAGASLLSGWLSARLGVTPAIDEVSPNDPLVVTLDVAGAAISATLAGQHVQVQSGRPSFVMPLPVETEAGAVAAELLSLTPDSGLCDALRVLAG